MFSLAGPSCKIWPIVDSWLLQTHLYFNHVGDVGEGAENLLMPVVPACLEGGGAPPNPRPRL